MKSDSKDVAMYDCLDQRFSRMSSKCLIDVGLRRFVHIGLAVNGYPISFRTTSLD